MKHKTIDNRKYARISVALDTRFVILSEGNDENNFSRTVQAKTRSLSANGACLETNVVQVDGLHICSSSSGLSKNKLKIEFDLPMESKTLQILGEVRWYDLTPENEEYLYNVGVLFMEVQEEDKKSLNRFIAKEKKKEKTFFSFIRKLFS